jgi:hypothetical protein
MAPSEPIPQYLFRRTPSWRDRGREREREGEREGGRERERRREGDNEESRQLE